MNRKAGQLEHRASGACPLRGRLFQAPIRLGTASEAEWQQMEGAAAAVVGGIIADIEERDRRREAGRHRGPARVST